MIEIDVWVVDLDDPRWPLRRLEETLAPEESRRLARLAPVERRRRAVARGVLRGVIAEREGVEPHEVRIRPSPFGKPELAGAGGPRALRFSLSRSGGTALVAVARGRRVGVDLERLRPVPDRDAIARRMLSTRVASDDGFLARWTRAEAYAKARGDGLRRSVALTLEDGDPARVARAGGVAPEGDWWLSDLDLPGHAAAVAVEGAGWRPIPRVREPGA